MLIMQVIIPFNLKWSYKFGIINDDCLVNPVGRFGYHPNILSSTLQNFGTFKLELIK